MTLQDFLNFQRKGYLQQMIAINTILDTIHEINDSRDLYDGFEVSVEENGDKIIEIAKIAADKYTDTNELITYARELTEYEFGGRSLQYALSFLCGVKCPNCNHINDFNVVLEFTGTKSHIRTCENCDVDIDFDTTINIKVAGHYR